MHIIAFIEDNKVIDKIIRHLRLTLGDNLDKIREICGEHKKNSYQ